MLRLSGRTQKYIVYGVELFLVYIIQFTPSLLPAFFGERPMLFAPTQQQIEEQHAHIVLASENLQRKDVLQRGEHRVLRAVGDVPDAEQHRHVCAAGICGNGTRLGRPMAIPFRQQ